MDKKSFRKLFLPLLIIFIGINTFCLLSQTFLLAHKIDNLVLAAANLLLFLLTVITLTMHSRAMKHSNPNVFVRSVMGGTLLKLMVIGISISAYLYIAGANRSLNAVLCAMVLYIIYTIIEVRGVLKMNKQVNGKG